MDVTVQATVTYRVSDPAVAAARLNFSVGEARAHAQAAWLRVHADAGVDGVATLHAHAAARFEENLPQIDNVTISPDVLTGLLARLGAGDRA
ncbi:hypothetical protein ACIP6X_34330 [Streptomyces coeruleorubidus]|uniref:hypothetical protein n=1 Tax=Streptomyces coeruleorubidus TaxID=116188 RepID=UPI0037F87702